MDKHISNHWTPEAWTPGTPSVLGKGVHAVRRLTLLITFVVFNLFYWSTKSLFLGIECVSKHQDLQIFMLKCSE